MVDRARVVMRMETEAADRTREARAIARRLHLDLDLVASKVAEDAADLILAMRADGLEVRGVRPAMRPGTGLRIDFQWLARRGVNLSRRQPLARAIGRDTRQVLDATAGLGHDAALLAALGFQVTAVERNPVLAIMLESALREARRDSRIAAVLGDRLQFEHQEARTIMQSMPGRFDCIYLDPMFPPRRKASALANKEIRLVRALVGDDDDAADLLEPALAAARRVVVKRPTWAPPFESAPTASITGKLVRYDLYVRG
jgi:16S rRNA (guanine1516-N2)-methyltransferase